MDDEEGPRQTYRILLHRWFKAPMILTFDDGDEAWSELSRTTPDLLISDVMHPGLSLLEMVTRLAERSINYPIVVVSAFHTPELERKLTQWPSLTITFLDKPITFDDLQKVVEDALKRYHRD